MVTPICIYSITDNTLFMFERSWEIPLLFVVCFQSGNIFRIQELILHKGLQANNATSGLFH